MNIEIVIEISEDYEDKHKHSQWGQAGRRFKEVNAYNISCDSNADYLQMPNSLNKLVK